MNGYIERQIYTNRQTAGYRWSSRSGRLTPTSSRMETALACPSPERERIKITIKYKKDNIGINDGKKKGKMWARGAKSVKRVGSVSITSSDDKVPPPRAFVMFALRCTSDLHTYNNNKCVRLRKKVSIFWNRSGLVWSDLPSFGWFGRKVGVVCKVWRRSTSFDHVCVICSE
jgi:hypothetical protein